MISVDRACIDGVRRHGRMSGHHLDLEGYVGKMAAGSLRLRVGLPGLEVGDGYVGEVPELFVPVESVAVYEFVGDVESAVGRLEV
jgi:hypothetical protein